MGRGRWAMCPGLFAHPSSRGCNLPLGADAQSCASTSSWLTFAALLSRWSRWKEAFWRENWENRMVGWGGQLLCPVAAMPLLAALSPCERMCYVAGWALGESSLSHYCPNDPGRKMLFWRDHWENRMVGWGGQLLCSVAAMPLPTQHSLPASQCTV